MDKASELLFARVRNAADSFRNSILFYPAALSAASILLFLATSRIDETLDDGIRFNLPLVESLLFAGSPNAARSILSTIATGWATILSVAFSVTLIALQLSVTRHTAEIVNEFENDKVNQFTLGWFIATVVYSLLVLKTVRTGENGIEPFTPIIGVNVSVLFAIVALFVFTSYLYNITSYIKTRTLIGRIAQRTVKSLEKLEDRRIDRKEAFAEPPDQDIIAEISAPQEGFVRLVDWNKMSKELSKHGLHERISVRWLVAVGDWASKDATMAAVHDRRGNADNGSNRGGGAPDADKIRHAIVSSVVMGQKRSLASDPMYGLEVLRNIAMKARNQSDINSIESCISGMFKVLFEAMKRRNVIGVPFYLSGAEKRDSDNSQDTLVIPKEDDLADAAFLELSDIYNSCTSSKDLAAIIRQFAREYSAWSMNLLDEGRTEEFQELTAWYSSNVKAAGAAQADSKVVRILSDFREKLRRHPYAEDIFDIYMRQHLADSEA